MSTKCILKADGFQIYFNLIKFQKDKKNMDVAIEFHLDPCISEVILKSTPTFIEINDIQRLVSYFEQHIISLQKNPDTESDIFVPLELGFQIQALAGEVRSKTDGEFSIRFMVNVGKGNENKTNVYVGGEALIGLKQVMDFISSAY